MKRIKVLRKVLSVLLLSSLLVSMLVGCQGQGAAEGETTSESGKDITIAFCFQDLETEFWVASYNQAIDTFKREGINVIEYNGNQDPNKQLEQINDAIAQSVDAILCVAQDSDSAITIAKAANKADIPIAFINREPSSYDGINCIAAVADNEAIAYEAGVYMVSKAKEKYEETGEKVVVGHMIGALGDANAVARKNGFERAIEEESDIFEKIVEIATEWDANTALANLNSALQANPDISFIACGSDFLYPQIQAALEPLGMWNKIGDANHVILGAVDGDSSAGKLMDDGYVDATAVQDVFFETDSCITALLEAIENGVTQPSERIIDSGFALTQENITERHNDMWGNTIK